MKYREYRYFLDTCMVGIKEECERDIDKLRMMVGKPYTIFFLY
jgi:hypothetical protein